MSKAQRVAELLSNAAHKRGGTLSQKDFADVEKQIKEEFPRNPCGEIMLGSPRPCCLPGPVDPVPVSPMVACERTLYNGPSNA